MKQITFASFKGGAGKTTAAMAVTSALSQKGERIALIDTDENMPLIEWRNNALKAGTWSDQIGVFEADDLRSFEKAFEDSEKQKFDYAVIDTRGGGSELNNACVINTHLVIIPSALTQLDMTQALTTFEHTIGLHQQMGMQIPTALLIQRVPVQKLTVSQRQDLAALSELPCFETHLHARDAFASLGKRGLLHLVHEQMRSDPMRRISASHLAVAMDEVQALANDFLEALEDA
ncbi:AAA family ATPase [Nitratireductor sp. XY-223]|uniref:nucleotide-binding protein n=1 Tax=Nitratireductor sp. XY-223 TaxID=2561926 RepID=UPI0010A9DFD0|nr:AAA family ATPase [Nitratireductor sp. XY-223]